MSPCLGDQSESHEKMFEEKLEALQVLFIVSKRCLLDLILVWRITTRPP